MARAGVTRRTAVALSVVLSVALGACSRSPLQADLAVGPTTVASAPSRSSSSTTVIDPSVVELMDGAGMTPEGRTLFLAAHPQVEDAAALADHCGVLSDPDGTESAHTYGCLVNGRIYVKSFTAPELHDLAFTVAAHELLHVVYGRLTVAQRTTIDAQLTAARSGNDLLEERLHVYATRSEDTLNEVHSILGTEFGGLSADLEAHYARYFDRAKVLAAYRSTLGDREARLRDLRAQVDDLDHQLVTMRAELDALRAAGDIRTYNQKVDAYNAVVARHNAVVGELNDALADYKRLIAS